VSGASVDRNLIIYDEFRTWLDGMTNSAHGSTARAILYAFMANAGIAIAKTWAAMITGSGSMLAEAIHSYADASNQVLLYLGLRQSTKAPDEEHPLGYHPEPLSQVWIAIVVLLIAIVLETFSLLGCIREIGNIRGERPFMEWFKETRQSELVVVLGEDIAALLGLGLALIFISLAALTGDPMYDALGSVCIGVVLIVVSVFLTLRVRSLLVGRSADPMIQEAIARIIADDDHIEKVFNIITMQLGPDTLLAAKIKLKSGIDIDTAIADINRLERHLKAEIPKLKWCFIEPDVED